MFKLEYYSKRGDILPLSNNPLFVLTNVDGMTTGAASLSSTVTIGGDGDTVNNAQVQPRSVILTVQFNNGVDVENAKRDILRVVKIKQNGALRWTQNNRTVQINGVVESVEMPRFSDAVAMQISLHCENPFWEDVDAVIQEINEYINAHYFTTNPYSMLYFPPDGIPFGFYDTSRTKTFHNAGDVAAGLEIRIQAFDTVTNPIIYDTDGNYFGVGYGTGAKQVIMHSGDIIVITTHKGNKTVKLNGVSLYDKIKPQSVWLQMQTGDNQFSINSDDSSVSNMTFNLIYKQRYI